MVSSIHVSGADRKAYLIIDAVMTFETSINVHDPAKPLGTELFSLIGPSADGNFLQWTVFGPGGVTLLKDFGASLAQRRANIERRLASEPGAGSCQSNA
jgi:hypothetical protein